MGGRLGQRPDEKAVAEYRSAYEAANGVPFPYDIEYGYGWYTLRLRGYKSGSYRRADLISMTRVLRSRLNPGDPS